jgi:OmpA-OmpF porin, OOP family
MSQLRTLIWLLCASLLAACASPGPGGIRQPWCAIGGALIGGGAGWAVNEEVLDNQEGDEASAAIGAAIGAAAGSILCPQEKPPEPPPAPPPAPEPSCDEDPDGDGIGGDGIAGCPDKCPGTPKDVEVDSDGCPKVGETLMILEGVNFAFDSAAISPESEAILDKAVEALKNAPTIHVRVEGHTDSIGSEQYNLGLSQKRAEAVVNYLVGQGIEASRLEPAGYGESEPVASNATQEDRYRNRRVELEVTSR